MSRSDIVEEEARTQIDEMDHIITTFEKMNDFLPLFNIQIFAHKRMKDTHYTRRAEEASSKEFMDEIFDTMVE